VPHHEDITWGVELQLHTFLTSALDGRECSASCPSCFTPGETDVSIFSAGDQVGPQQPIFMWWQQEKYPFPALPGIEPWMSSP